MSGFIAVGHFLLTLFFSLVLFLLWARIFLRFYKISSLNPVSQMIYALTDPFVGIVAGFFPDKKGKLSTHDWPSFTLVVIVEIIKYILLSFLLYHALMPLTYLVLFVITDLIAEPCNLLFYILLIRIIMSWVNPNWNHPLEAIIRVITNPILAFGRSLIPEISGFDFSPFVILVILKVIVLFMSSSLPLRLVYT